MSKDKLGDRMKTYEDIERKYLYKRTPVIIRIDGKSFHSFTKQCKKPFDDNIIYAMENTCKFLVENIQGCKIGYVQSDEISLLLTDYDTFETDSWFGYNIQKIVSVAASMTGVQFTIEYDNYIRDNVVTSIKPAYFDARTFNISKEEVCNYFIWRWQDCKRNSMSMLAQSLFSQKELHGKKFEEQGKMCFDKGKDWFALNPQYCNGTLFIRKWNGEKTVTERYTDFNLLNTTWRTLIDSVVYNVNDN